MTSETLNTTERDRSDEPKKARLAISLVFFLNGAVVATWASRIPAIQDKLHLTTSTLGIALLSMAVGALAAMSFAGALASRFGSRPVIVSTMICTCLTLILPAYASNLFLLSASVALLGLFAGSMDVAMNAHAVAVERAYSRPIMSSFHALFSIGGIAGACFGALMAWFRVAPELHFPCCAIALLIAGLLVKNGLLPASVDATGAKVNGAIHLETLQLLCDSRFLAALSALMFCCFLVEGAMGDWSGVFLQHTLKTDAGFAALGYASFSVAMSMGRLLGDRLKEKFGSPAMVSGGSILALAGLCSIVFPGIPVLALVGFALIGLGVSNIVPIAFTSAGNAPDMEPGPSIATVALVGYFGLLAGPPVLGFVAEFVTLKYALALLSILLISMIFLARFVRTEA
ncbi:MAG TPA: MFS transporter [Drouetiella sp.]